MSVTQDIVDRIGGPRRAMIAFAGIAVTVGVLVLSRAMSAPNWVPALTGVPIGDTSGLTDKLSEAGIAFRLDGGGSQIMVAEPDLARARVTLAKGGLANGARPGLELFDRQTWGWNDFTQRVNFRRALEGELERTIGHMRGIERAEVHIAIAEHSAFRRADERPSTASVLIALPRGETPAEDVVRGIAQLVSSSVDGLAIEHVSIHDETGRMWSQPGDGSAASLTSNQVRMQEERERYLAQQAEALVSQIVGAGNARVRVSVTMGFDKVERTTQSVDPAKQALTSEQKAEIVPGAQGGAGSTNVANNYENTKSTEVFSGAVGTIKRLTVAVLINEKRLPAASATDTLPHFAPRTAAELSQIDALVRSAVGVDSARGDVVSVINQAFEVAPAITRAEPSKPDLGSRVEQFQRPVLSVLGIIAMIVLGFITLNALRAPVQTLSGSTALAALPAGTAAAMTNTRSPQAVPTSMTDTPPSRAQVAAAVQEHPDASARMMKAWLKES